MQFEWDEEKNLANIIKHGIGFETASKIFARPTVSWRDTRREYGEVRIHTVGMKEDLLILTVIHTDRNDIIRIISARLASKKERIIYEKAIHKRADH
jgi:uncharacterized protein